MTCSSALAAKAASAALRLLGSCRLCPRHCVIDRASGSWGPCGVADVPMVGLSRPMPLEERCLSGSMGSGGIFLQGCTQSCVFCQNADINLEFEGKAESVGQLVDRFLALQHLGCHNLHFVSPTHQLPWLLEALAEARSQGLNLPVVYNTGGYESIEVLRLLEGVVDIYLPDFKFWDPKVAQKYLRVPGYPEVARAALVEMKRQVGDLEMDSRGLATRGLLVRHLAMPGFLDDARRIYEWIASELGPDTCVNVMAQYLPMHKADRFPEISEALHNQEWQQARAIAREAGLRNLVVDSTPVEPSQIEIRRNAIVRQRKRPHKVMATL